VGGDVQLPNAVWSAAAPDRDTTVLTGRLCHLRPQRHCSSASCFAQIEWLWHCWICAEATGNFAGRC